MQIVLIKDGMKNNISKTHYIKQQHTRKLSGHNNNKASIHSRWQQYLRVCCFCVNVHILYVYTGSVQLSVR